MENRHGLCADFTVHNPIAQPEPAVALGQVDEHRKLHEGVVPKSLGADKTYHQKEFVQGCRQRAVSPHVACKEGMKVAGLDGRTTRSLAVIASVKACANGWKKSSVGSRRLAD